jgi:ribosomal protein S5
VLSQQASHGGPLLCLPATFSSCAARAPSLGSPLIRLPNSSSSSSSGAGPQQQQQQRRHFAQDAPPAAKAAGRDGDRDDEGGRQANHARPRWRDMDANQALLSVPYQMELAMMHRQLQDRSALEDQVREKFKLDLWDNVLVDVKRTVKVTKSAKVETFHAIVCTGNQNGMFGVGEGADSNVQKAVTTAFFKSFASIVNVPLYRGHTVYHRIDHKRHTTNIMMLPKQAGRGIRASNLMYELCQLAGIKDITIKVRCAGRWIAGCLCQARARPGGWPGPWSPHQGRLAGRACPGASRRRSPPPTPRCRPARRRSGAARATSPTWSSCLWRRSASSRCLTTAWRAAECTCGKCCGRRADACPTGCSAVCTCRDGVRAGRQARVAGCGGW